MSIKSIMLVAALCLVSSLGFGQQLKLGPPADPVATWQPSPTSNAAVVNVYWKASLAPVRTGIYYNVFAAPGAVRDPNAVNIWKLVATTKDTGVQITLRALGLDTPQTTSFFVRAYLLSSNADTLFSPASVIAVAIWGKPNPGGNCVRFDPIPPREVRFDASNGFSYQVHAVGCTANSGIVYALTVSPQGSMKIDPASGKITWLVTTTDDSAWVAVTATDADGNAAKAYFHAIVGAGRPTNYAKVHGTVTDAAANIGIPGASVVFSAGMLGMPALVFMTGRDGSFEGALPAGIAWIASASAEGYDLQYWKFVSQIDSATKLSVAEGTTTEVDFALRALPTGVVTGLVLDSATGNGIPYAVVTLISKGGSPDSNNVGGRGKYGRQFIVKTDQTGFYAIKLPPDDYVARAEARGYASEWYDHAGDVSSATIITVGASASVRVLFELNGMIAPNFAVVSGAVYSLATGATTGDPIAGAKVTVEQVGGDGGYSVTVSTDRSGRYFVSVPTGAAYIASVAARGYYAEYFDAKRNPTEADRIRVAADVSGIDFHLEAERQDYLTLLGGQVLACDSIGSTVMAKVIVFRANSAGRREPVAATVTDSAGFYAFQHLAPGIYLIEAIPATRAFAPGYYTGDSSCSFRWKRAAAIRLHDSTRIGDLTIYVRPTKRHRGFANTGGGASVLGGGAGTTPLLGAEILALDVNGEIIDYTESDADGSFSMPELDPGTYTVTLDKVDFDVVSEASATLDYGQHASATVSLLASPAAPLGVAPSAMPSSISLEQNYPNPFNPTTTIDYTLDRDAMVTLEVWSLLGRRVSTLASGMQSAGPQEALWTAEGLPSGTYLYRLTVGALTTEKSMTLLK